VRRPGAVQGGRPSYMGEEKHMVVPGLGYTTDTPVPRFRTPSAPQLGGFACRWLGLKPLAI
jgi:hypothetical protein